MFARLDYNAIAPSLLGHYLSVEKRLEESSLDGGLLELVRLRVSQINGCAFCVSLHTRWLRERFGESNERIDMLAVWPEAVCYDDRERAALAWAETVTRVAATGVPDSAYERARAEFGEQEIVELTTAIANINVWNRLAVSFRAVPGTDPVRASGSTVGRTHR